MPIEHSLEDKLISHLIECLTHTKLKYQHEEYEIDENEDEDEERSDQRRRAAESISIHSSSKKMQKKQFLILHKIIQAMCRNPYKLTNKPLGGSNFRKATFHDYEELADNDDY